MKPKECASERTCGSFGSNSAPLLASSPPALFLTAMALDPGWRIGRMWLSDLGVRQAAWAFNTAFVLAGALILPYATAITLLHPKGKLTWLGTFPSRRP